VDVDRSLCGDQSYGFVGIIGPFRKMMVVWSANVTGVRDVLSLSKQPYEPDVWVVYDNVRFITSLKSIESLIRLS
jgi:hypothetical protein